MKPLLKTKSYLILSILAVLTFGLLRSPAPPITRPLAAERLPATVITNLQSLERSYKPVFVSVARGKDTTAQPYRYDLPYATLTNGLAAATNKNDLLYVLDGGFYGGAGVGPSLITAADVFLEDGVMITNYCWIPTNSLPVGGVWHMYGLGSLYEDTTSLLNTFFLLDNGTATQTNTSITAIIYGKNFISPTNEPIVLGGRSEPYTNYAVINATETVAGPLETDASDDPGPQPQSLIVAINATDIISGSGQGSVGANGSAQDTTNRFYTLNARRTVTLSPTGSTIQYSFCTFNINGALFKDLRSGNTASTHHVVNLNNVHFGNVNNFLGAKFYSGSYWFDGPAPSVCLSLGTYLMTNNATPAPVAFGGTFYVSNGADLYWVTASKTNLVTLGH